MACSTTGGIIACKASSVVTTTITTPIFTTVVSILTTTEQIYATFRASPGQTLTISAPAPPWSITPPISESTRMAETEVTSRSLTVLTGTPSPYTTYTGATTSRALNPTETLTELVVVIENASGSIYTSSTLTFPVATTTLTYQTTATPLVVTVGQNLGSGWNTWSEAAKGGLIAGCLIAFFVLSVLTLCLCCRRRKRISIATGSRFHTQPEVVAVYPHNFVNSHPLMRGGGVDKYWRRISFGHWFTRNEEQELWDIDMNTIKAGKQVAASGRASFYSPPERTW